MNPYYKKYQKSIRKATKQWQETHQAEVLWHCAKQRAKRFEHKFTILSEDVLIPDKCPILGIKLTNIRGHGRIWTNASLDRIDSTKGYVKGNIQVISDLANRMKQNATPEQLLLFAKGILTVYQK